MGINSMKLERITPQQYSDLIDDCTILFNKGRFGELNKHKVNEVIYLCINEDNNPVFGLMGGRKNRTFMCPFSAPFSFPVSLKKNTRMISYDQSLDVLMNYLNSEGFENIIITFPPMFYDEHNLSAWVNVFFRNHFSVKNAEIDYALYLDELNTDYYQYMIWKKARKHLRKAISSGCMIREAKNDEDMNIAYNIIKKNHDTKNRETSMTLQEIINTSSLDKHDAFIARIDGVDVAAMIYCALNDRIVICRYSGYLSEYGSSGAMNYLSYYGIKYYGDRGYKIIDRAKSSDDSIPNYGLCDFNESIGGRRSIKYTFEKRI